jgi:hypothetical protein
MSMFTRRNDPSPYIVRDAIQRFGWSMWFLWLGLVISVDTGYQDWTWYEWVIISLVWISVIASISIYIKIRRRPWPTHQWIFPGQVVVSEEYLNMLMDDYAENHCDIPIIQIHSSLN